MADNPGDAATLRAAGPFGFRYQYLAGGVNIGPGWTTWNPDGTFVKEVFIAKNTLGDGSTWDIAFSKDPQQKYMYLADGANEKVYIILRESMEVLTSFGDGGRQPGEFYAVHSIATDSKGNIFTTETYRGQRIQKFVNKGMAPVTKKDQGVVWPKTAKSSM